MRKRGFWARRGSRGHDSGQVIDSRDGLMITRVVSEDDLDSAFSARQLRAGLRERRAGVSVSQ